MCSPSSPGEGHRPVSGGGLGLAELNSAADLYRDLGDLEPASQQVDTAAAEAGHLAYPEPAVGAHQDQGAVARVDRIRECCDLVGVEVAHLVLHDPRQRYAVGGVVMEQPGVDGRSQDLGQHLRALVHGGRSQPGRRQLGDPFTDRHVLDVAQVERPEPRQHVPAHDALVTSPRARAQVHRRGVRASRPVSEANT